MHESRGCTAVVLKLGPLPVSQVVRLQEVKGPVLLALLAAVYSRRLDLTTSTIEPLLSLALFLEVNDVTQCCCAVSCSLSFGLCGYLVRVDGSGLAQCCRVLSGPAAESLQARAC